MIETTPFLPGLSPVAGTAIVARFDGGELSSDAGVLALREVEARLGVADQFAACLDDPRDPERCIHSLAEIVLRHGNETPGGAYQAANGSFTFSLLQAGSCMVLTPAGV